jgi:hypothetical protein
MKPLNGVPFAFTEGAAGMVRSLFKNCMQRAEARNRNTETWRGQSGEKDSRDTSSFKNARRILLQLEV